jgi:hypothetical protein
MTKNKTPFLLDERQIGRAYDAHFQCHSALLAAGVTPANAVRAAAAHLVRAAFEALPVPAATSVILQAIQHRLSECDDDSEGEPSPAEQIAILRRNVRELQGQLQQAHRTVGGACTDRHCCTDMHCSFRLTPPPA